MECALKTTHRWLSLLCLSLLLLSGAAKDLSAQEKPDRNGFVRLFDGKTLDGWTLIGGHGPGYVPIEGGVLDCPADGGGNLFTVKEYADFIYRFEFKLDKGANNGVGIRAPLQGDAAYVGMECQILDDDDPMYAHLEPG